MHFSPQKDLLFTIILWLPVAALIIIAIVKLSFFILFIGFAVAWIISWFWFQTYYKVTENMLMLFCGPLHLNISLEQIKSITKTKNLLSSYALAHNRLEITYGRHNKVFIAPAKETFFLKTLLNHNPGIKLSNELEMNLNREQNL